VGVLRKGGTTQIVGWRRKFWHWVVKSHQLPEDAGAHVLKSCCIVVEEPAILSTQIRTVENEKIVYSGYYITPVKRAVTSNVARLSITLQQTGAHFLRRLREGPPFLSSDRITCIPQWLSIKYGEIFLKTTHCSGGTLHHHRREHLHVAIIRTLLDIFKKHVLNFQDELLEKLLLDLQPFTGVRFRPCHGIY
jgi:hypothetical protein